MVDELDDQAPFVVRSLGRAQGGDKIGRDPLSTDSFKKGLQAEVGVRQSGGDERMEEGRMVSSDSNESSTLATRQRRSSPSWDSRTGRPCSRVHHEQNKSQQSEPRVDGLSSTRSDGRDDTAS